MMRDPLGLLTSAARRGDVVPLEFLGDSRVLLLNHPEDITRVLVTDNRRFPKRHPYLAQMKRFVGEGVATSEGELWRKQRRLIQAAFSRERVTTYCDDIAACTARALEAWRPGEVRDLYADFMRVVLEGTARALFSTQVGDEAREVVEAVSVVMDHFADPLFLMVPQLERLPLPRFRRLRAAQRRLGEIVDDVIRVRRAEADGSRTDLLAALLAARDEHGAAMPDRQIYDEVMTLYIAGYEPMAVALGWTFHLLSRHPEALARASEEARGVLGGRAATHEDLARLPWIAATIDECLRLYPPAWTSMREADEACEFRGHAVPRGGYVWFSAWVVHRDPRWYEAPGEFRPERWLDGLARRLPRCAYLPYGAGPRMCVGAPLAGIELAAIVATVLARWRLEPVPGREPRPYPSINLRPRGGVWMRVRAA